MRLLPVPRGPVCEGRSLALAARHLRLQGCGDTQAPDKGYRDGDDGRPLALVLAQLTGVPCAAKMSSRHHSLALVTDDLIF